MHAVLFAAYQCGSCLLEVDNFFFLEKKQAFVWKVYFKCVSSSAGFHYPSQWLLTAASAKGMSSSLFTAAVMLAAKTAE